MTEGKVHKSWKILQHKLQLQNYDAGHARAKLRYRRVSDKCSVIRDCHTVFEQFKEFKNLKNCYCTMFCCKSKHQTEPLVSIE